MTLPRRYLDIIKVYAIAHQECNPDQLIAILRAYYRYGVIDLFLQWKQMMQCARHSERHFYSDLSTFTGFCNPVRNVCSPTVASEMSNRINPGTMKSSQPISTRNAKVSSH